MSKDDNAARFAKGKPRDTVDRLSVAKRAGEHGHGFFGLLAADAVDLGEVSQDLAAGEGRKLTAGRDVPFVTAFTKCHRKGEEVTRAPLKGKGQPDDERRLFGRENGLKRGSEIELVIERHELTANTGHAQRRGDVTQAQVLFDLGTHERDV